MKKAPKTAFKKGNPGKQKGTVSKASKTVKQVLADLIDKNASRAQEELDKLEGRYWIEAYCRLADYVIPKAKHEENPDAVNWSEVAKAIGEAVRGNS